MRALVRNMKNHSSYYSCEYCRASATYYKDPDVEKDEKKRQKEHNQCLKKINSDIKVLKNSQHGSLNEKHKTQQQIKSLQRFKQQTIADHNAKPRVRTRVRHLILLFYYSLINFNFNNLFQTHLIWPADRRNSEERTMEHIMHTVANLPNLTSEEREGVCGYSPLMDLPGFNFLRAVPCEYLHHICLGVVKRLIELSFSVGDSRKRITKRKLSHPSHFNEIMRQTKVPAEFSRRGRSLDLHVMKGEEFRNVILFFFFIILDCIQSSNGFSERQLWLIFAFQIRSYVLPDCEYVKISQSELKFCLNRFCTLFEELFGQSNSSYNIHMMSHLNLVRERGPLTETSTFKNEGYYGEMRRSYAAGTASTGKQILQNAFIKRQLPHHRCQKKILFSDQDTPKSSNSIIYIYSNAAYTFYKIKKILPSDSFLCTILGKRKYSPPETPKLNWSSVGVFRKAGLSDLDEIIYRKDIHGKGIVVQNMILTGPNNILRE